MINEKMQFFTSTDHEKSKALGLLLSLQGISLPCSAFMRL